MTSLPPALQELAAALGRLPGIGRKTATRLAFFILNAPREEGEILARAIMKVKAEVKRCSRCFNFTESDPCHICSDERRNHKLICLVEDSQTILLIEKTNEYRGLYHVLGGVISPLDGIGPEALRIKELLGRLEGVEEVILALTPSTEGEATSIYLAKLLKPQGIRITR
ncbi:MAG: recombination protein RecR, partial [Calditrichaeota bacterium]|nr:recombination protein RecR [Calditrichota bacterium]